MVEHRVARRWSARPARGRTSPARCSSRRARRASARPTPRSAAVSAEPNALGYSAAGVVLEACDGAPAAPGELVACAGAGSRVPRRGRRRPAQPVRARSRGRRRPRTPRTATVASIALHGVRLAEVGLGDVAAVVGLGLVGQLALELLARRRVRRARRRPGRGRRASSRARRASSPPPTRPSSRPRRCGGTDGRGADARARHRRQQELRAAGHRRSPSRASARSSASSATCRSSPRGRPCSTRSCGSSCRAPTGRGATTRPTRSGGIDYPAGYVRWTEGRNLEEVLRLMAAGRAAARRGSRRTPSTSPTGAQAYALLEGDEPSLGILLRYPGRTDAGPAASPLDGHASAAPACRSRATRLRIGVDRRRQRSRAAS